MLAAILGNLLTYFMTNTLSLPIRLDTVGTLLIGALFGPFWGAACGACYGLLWGIANPAFMFFAIPHCLMGYIVGKCYPKDSKDTFQICCTAAFLIVISIIFTTPINIIFREGYTDNLWGDALYDMLYQTENFAMLSAVCAESLVDVPDKILSIFILTFLLRVHNS